MKEFIRMMVDSEDKKFAEVLRIALREEGVFSAIELCDNHHDNWGEVWHIWMGDVAFERLEAWFARLPVPIGYKWQGCGDCAICKAMEGGEDEESLLEAFALQNEKSFEAQMRNSYVNVHKSIKQVESALNEVIKNYKLENQLSVSEVKEWVRTESGDALEANRAYMLLWMSYFEEHTGSKGYNAVVQAFTDAWNYFPHEILGGKSPRDLVE